mmetsp:Transcript_20887/g.48471  ORF Transcript_20887/g.48471 Transcript_20887/m.48471 type:complete len:200 (+) Transcript_20887:954-1553(+)
MVDVNVDVQDPRVPFEQLEDAHNNVVHVTETRRLALLGMVQSARPIHRDVTVTLVQLARAIDRSSRVDRAKFVKSVEDGAVGVLAHVESLHLRRERGSAVLSWLHLLGLGCLAEDGGRIWSYPFQKLDILRRMKPRHLLGPGAVWAVDVHFSVKAVGEQQVVGELEPVRLHRVARAVVVVPHIAVIKVGNLLLGRCGAR